MLMLLRLLVFSLCLCAAQAFSAEDKPIITFASSNQTATVVELYTSEGCSSCPPADRWLSGLRDHPDLFKNLVPMAFHVDYWDYIGWKDPFAKAEYSMRQRILAKRGILNSVYTPAFVINAQENKSWFSDRKFVPPRNKSTTGILAGELDGSQLTITLTISDAERKLKKQDGRVLNLAYLGNRIISKVTAGENNHRRLEHDFVVLSHWQVGLGQLVDDRFSWFSSLPEVPNRNQTETALVAWVTAADNDAPLQATGTFITTQQSR